jgi:hypothetical protein
MKEGIYLYQNGKLHINIRKLINKWKSEFTLSDPSFIKNSPLKILKEVCGELYLKKTGKKEDLGNIIFFF